MTAEHKYEMTISLQIVEHLGLNLYSNTSAVISEAVANAWDADAKTVEITLEKDCITIKDDGCGMDTDDINNKYLTVGYQRRHLVPITPMLNRKVMGRKGIGKLSLLSIAETITIYSSKNGQKNALQISTQKLREAVSQTQTYYPEEVDDSGIDFEGNGTKIVLTNLKKSRTTALAGKLKQRLARRFAVIGADKQFEVKVNGEVFILNHHSNDVNRFLYPELRLSSRSVDKGTEHSAPLSALFYFLPFFPRLPFFSSDGLPLPLPSFINLFASSISSFISTINTFSFSSHSSRVRA